MDSPRASTSTRPTQRTESRWLEIFWQFSPEEWRAHVLDVILRAGAVFAPFVYVPSVVIALYLGEIGVALVDTLAIVTVYLLVFWKGIPYRLKAAVFLTALFILGAWLLVRVGPISQIYLLGFSVLTTLLLGLRMGVMTIVLNALYILTVGTAGLAAPEMAIQGWDMTFTSWAILTSNFVLINTILTFSLGGILAAIERALLNERDVRAALEVERAGLEMVNETLQDQIAERLHAEALLQDSELRYRSIFDASPMPMWVYDLETRAFLEVNEAAVRCYGYSREEFLAMTIPDIWQPQEVPRLHAYGVGLHPRKAALSHHQRKDGSQILVEITSHFVEFAGKRAELVLANDVSERTKIEVALRQSETLLRIAGQAAQLGGWTLDVATGTVAWSDEACAIHDVPPGTSPAPAEAVNYYAPAHRERVFRAMIQCMMTGAPFDLEAEIITATGRHAWVRTIGSAERDAQGAIRRVQGGIQDISEKKRADEALRRVETRLTATLEHLGEAFYTLDTDRRFTYMNREAERLLQCNRSDVLGKIVTDVFPPESIVQIMEWFDQAVKQKRNVEWEGYSPLLGRWLDARAYPSEDGIAVYFRDIGDRKAAEQELLTAKRLLEQTFASLSEAVLVIDKPTRTIVQCNPAAEHVFGYSPAELIGRTTEFLHVDHDHFLRFATMGDPQLTEHGAFYTEYTMKRKNGTIINTEHTVTVMFDEQGLPFGVVSVIRDITERKRAESALREVTSRLQGILENSPVLMCVLDFEGNYTLVNRSHALLFRKELNEIEGKNLSELIPEDAAAIFKARIAQVRATRSQLVVEDELLIGETPRVFHTILFPLFDEHNDVSSIGGIALDVTEQLHARQERERLQSQLIQAQKMEAVGRLAGGVAHDFNNMLGVILGYTEMLVEHPDTPESIEPDLEEIRAAAHRSADLTKQLLAFARQQTIAPEVLDLNSVIEKLLNMLRRLIGEDIELLWSPGGNLWPVKMDPTQLDQVLANLAVNARDAIDGTGRISIATTKVHVTDEHDAGATGVSPGRYNLLTISDNGRGMSRETASRIFEPFFTTKEQGKGTGLGLSTVYGIIRQNDGFVNVYSEVNVGTTFRVYLPSYTGEVETPADDEPIEVLSRGAETILVVEDEAALLTLTTRMLERLGYTVLAAQSPQEARDKATQYPGEIHLLITDVIMPTMNGLDLSRELEAIRPDIKSIFMSGYTADVIAHHGVLDDRIHFIPKPFTTAEVAAKIREVLGNT